MSAVSRVRKIEDGAAQFEKLVATLDTGSGWVPPFPSLEAITRQVPGGEIVLVQARTGLGKTTFAGGCVLGAVDAGQPVYVVPTETSAVEYVKRLACWAEGESYAYWATKRARDDAERGLLPHAEYERRREALIAQFDRLTAPDSALWVKPVRFPRVEELPKYYAEARDFGASLLLVDHVDLLRGGSDDKFASSTAAWDALVDLGQESGIVSLIMSQADASLVKGSPLEQYAPPTLGQMYMGQHKNHSAAITMGLYRPRKPHVPREVLEAIARKEVKPTEALMPRRMGVVMNKHRFGEGDLEGERCWLAFDRGRIRERTLEEVAQDNAEIEACSLTDAERTTGRVLRRAV